MKMYKISPIDNDRICELKNYLIRNLVLYTMISKIMYMENNNFRAYSLVILPWVQDQVSGPNYYLYFTDVVPDQLITEVLLRFG